MKRTSIILGILVMAAGVFSGIAGAHDCTDTDDPNTCEETPVVPNWRDGNYVPLFDLGDRNDEEQRKDAQRWREECNTDDPNSSNYQSRQMCAWAYGGQSHTPNEGSDPTDPNSYAPNEWHMGFAANHCFLGEFAHDCEDHHNGEGTHDAHGGAIYADVCVTENPESKYCKEGLKDTQVGLTIMDHNPCGTVVPIVACTDEYHVIRPFDPDFTMGQMEDSVEYIGRIIEDPQLYLCGYPQYSVGHPLCPAESGGGEGDAATASTTGTAVTVRGSGASVLRGEHGAVATPMAIDAWRAGSGSASGSRAGAAAAQAWPLLLVGAAIIARAYRRFALR
jgi:hypothetical protein